MSDRTQKRAQFLINTAYVATIALFVYLALKYVISWVLPFVLAFCIVSAIHPLIMRAVRLLNTKKEIVSIIIIAMAYALIGTLLFFLVMQIIFTIRDSLALLPMYYENAIQPTLLSIGTAFTDFVGRLPEAWRGQAMDIQNNIIAAAQNFLLNVSSRGVLALTNFTKSVPSFMIAFLFTIMLSFFISAQYDKILRFFKTQLPPRALKIARDTRLIIIDTIFKYFTAAMTLMAITFTELSIGLLFLRKENAILIASGIALFDALPFFGAGAVLVPWAFIELLRGNVTFAVGLFILYGVIVVVRNIMEPKVVGDKLGLNPVVSLCAIYLGFKVVGVLGMIIFPMLTQICLELHRKGSIRLFREAVKSDIPDDG